MMQMVPSILCLALWPVLSSAATGGIYQGWHTGAKNTSSSYLFYKGDGTEISGWPAMSEWLDFETIWNDNAPAMLKSCGNIYTNVTNNLPELEMPLIKLAIEVNALATSVDPRFILAIMLQESEGCIRSRTTSAAGSTTIFNPGLMQDHSGQHSCNPHGTEINPCPWDQIYGMIQDGVAGTTAGDGLAACLNEVVKLSRGNSTVPPPKSEAQAYYMAARLYNSGVLDPAGILDNASGSTGCYCSDIANRLTGWTAADPKFAKSCCLDTTCKSKPTTPSKLTATGSRGLKSRLVMG